MRMIRAGASPTTFTSNVLRKSSYQEQDTQGEPHISGSSSAITLEKC